jgi:hypothetical protein
MKNNRLDLVGIFTFVLILKILIIGCDNPAGKSGETFYYGSGDYSYTITNDLYYNGNLITLTITAYSDSDYKNEIQTFIIKSKGPYTLKTSYREIYIYYATSNNYKGYIRVSPRFSYETSDIVDMSVTSTDTSDIADIIDTWCGVWYSHYGTRKLDGYRIGKWQERYDLLPQVKLDLFPEFNITHPQFRGTDAIISDEEYFVFYDDTEYETYPGSGGNIGTKKDKHYIGIVRAVTEFYSSGSNKGSIIIEYLDGCYPTWDTDIYQTPLSFFGIYYRVLTPDIIQIANAINLQNKYSGKKYYTETATLEEAVIKNKVANEAEFIEWGTIFPQDREL